MDQPLAYLNGEFIPASNLLVSVDDLGFLQGVAVSERLRTFRGRLFRLNEHLDRLANSLKIVDFSGDVSADEIGVMTQELVERNRPLLAEGDDLGLSLFVTPGTLAEPTPTIGIQAYPLPFGQWSFYYDEGQSLTETGIRQVPSSCWPAELKCRSRMHYYLADRLADRRYTGSRAVLLDQDGFVSEASTANLVVYRDSHGITSPPKEKILPGVSLSVLAELARQLDVPFRYADFEFDDLASADEILLCSTSPCVWPVTRLNGQPTGRGVEGRLYRRLLAAWGDLVGLDIVAQARRFADRK